MKLAKKILPAAAILLVALAAFVALTYSGRVAKNPVSTAVINATRPYPKLTGAKTITLSCDYKGKDLSVSETLYSSLDQYYKSDPTKKIDYYSGDNKGFVYTYEKDKTVFQLSSDIKKLAAENSLDSDQTLDLATCLMQSIPYDTAKATKILSKESYKYPVSELIPRYPYETLYDFTGVCTDKSYLGALVYKELGYKSSLLVFDSQKHMSVGVGVPNGYGDFNTPYAITELTGKNFLVGDIPLVSSSVGSVTNTIGTLPGTSGDVELTNLSSVVDISSGNNYVQIIDRVSLKKDIAAKKATLEEMNKQLESAKSELTSYEGRLSSAEASYKANPTSKTYNDYRNVYNQYLSVYNKVDSLVNSYNSLVADYNSKVAKYRSL